MTTPTPSPTTPQALSPDVQATIDRDTRKKTAQEQRKRDHERDRIYLEKLESLLDAETRLKKLGFDPASIRMTRLPSRFSAGGVRIDLLGRIFDGRNVLNEYGKFLLNISRPADLNDLSRIPTAPLPGEDITPQERAEAHTWRWVRHLPRGDELALTALLWIVCLFLALISGTLDGVGRARTHPEPSDITFRHLTLFALAAGTATFAVMRFLEQRSNTGNRFLTFIFRAVRRRSSTAGPDQQITDADLT